MIFAFVADRNLFIDAYLISGAENGYKAKFRLPTTICCGCDTNRNHNIWWYFCPLE